MSTNASPNASPNANSGPSGSSGPSGPSDPSGTTGNQGSTGSTGSTLIPGTTVSTGPYVSGFTGPSWSTLTLNQSYDISGGGAHVTNQQGTNQSGDNVTYTAYDTVPHVDNDAVIITGDLTQTITSTYDDGNGANPVTTALINEIKAYAADIKCTDFQGKGTIDDYKQLFAAASKIANETKQMQLSVDISGFAEFGQVADDMAALFTGFTLKLQSINIINDVSFLQAVKVALAKIANLSNAFGLFQQTILATATIELPKSAHDATLAVEGVMSEVACAMQFINHFVDSNSPAPASANLSAVEQNVIVQAVKTIENWSILCDNDVSVAMTTNPDVMYMKQASATLSSNAAIMRNNVSMLRQKFLNLQTVPTP